MELFYDFQAIVFARKFQALSVYVGTWQAHNGRKCYRGAKPVSIHAFFIRNLPQGLVLKVPYL